MDEDTAARLAALEALVQQLTRATAQPVLDLIEWAAKERVNDLGRTRGALLAIEAAVRALAPAADRAEIERRLAQAEASLVTLALPDRAMDAAAEGFREVAEGIRRALGGA